MMGQNEWKTLLIVSWMTQNPKAFYQPEGSVFWGRNA